MARILIVDDDPIVIALLMNILTKANHNVVVASSGSEAIEQINIQIVDLILTDANMPGGISGFNLISKIRKSESFKNIPAILITGRRDASDVLLAVKSGINDYIIKPFDHELLLNKINNLLNPKEQNRLKKPKVS